ncbi:MAG: protein phosphatase 2C domain-containing protein [Actinomycetota bacterium]
MKFGAPRRGALAIRGAGLTNRGAVRRVNEDAFLVSPPLFAVADGMGGHAGGEIAAEIALHELTQWLSDPGPKGHDALTRAVEGANQAVLSAGSAVPALGDMGCALTVAWFHRGKVTIAHVGDTRAYVFSGGRIEQLTTDMTMATRAAQESDAASEDVKGLPGGNVLTDAIGRKDISIETVTRRLEVGSRVLLCTDGLHRQVSDEAIERILRESIDTETACQQLVVAAKQAGGKDNVAVAVVDVTLVGAPPDPSPKAAVSIGHRWTTITLFSVVALFLALVLLLTFIPTNDRLVARLEGDRLTVVRERSTLGLIGRGEEILSSADFDDPGLPVWAEEMLALGVPLTRPMDANSLARDLQRLVSPSPPPTPAPSPP